ncbi:MAG: hypothetical protein EOP88_28255 [Verrucomicrobiaceae bacterium]|nr:MAG: hypothetical protein EOP88_28255 [Verrucomicrobiaceae bacterium]
MEWNECEWWTGTVNLSFGKDAELSVTPYDPSVSRLPDEHQKEAMAFHLEHGEEVFSAVLAALKPYYEEMRPKYLRFLGRQAGSLMPPLDSAADLTRLIDLRHVHIESWTKAGIGYVGLQFGCTWDQEHGLGFMMHQARVVSVGDADVSFAWEPEEADEP